MEIDYKYICDTVCDVARKAAHFIKCERGLFCADSVEIKSSQNDLVTYVDRETELLIVDMLSSLIEGATFITEEKMVANSDDTSGYCWVIDPIDGTTNFAHSLAPYCVSIALMYGGEVVVGVVYEVVNNDCFSAWKGSDAYLNGYKIEVSNVKTMSRALVAVGCTATGDNAIEHLREQSSYLSKNSHGFRRTGSAAANLVYVAAGRFDAFAQINLNSWDVAAGAFIAKAAGAIVTDNSGGDNYLFGREIIATNRYLYDEYSKFINSFNVCHNE